MKDNHWIIYTDGGARGNPGPAAIGVVISVDGTNVATIKKTIGVATNNVAEYDAVIEAFMVLQALQEKYGRGESVSFFLDSLLAVQQLRGVYKIKNPTLKNRHTHIKKLEMEVAIPVSYTHIARDQNKEADLLVNQALDAVC